MINGYDRGSYMNIDIKEIGRNDSTNELDDDVSKKR